MLGALALDMQPAATVSRGITKLVAVRRHLRMKAPEDNRMPPG